VRDLRLELLCDDYVAPQKRGKIGNDEHLAERIAGFDHVTIMLPLSRGSWTKIDSI